MVSFLITISFILHFLAFFLIVILSIRVKRSNENEKKLLELQNEIDDMFQAYLLEMKEENEHLLNTIEKHRENNSNSIFVPAKQPVSVGRHVLMRSPAANIQQKRAHDTYQTHMKQQDSPSARNNSSDYLPPVPSDDEKYDQSYHSQVFSLYEQGLQVNEIAKKLNKGQTEIELLLKFRQ